MCTAITTLLNNFFSRKEENEEIMNIFAQNNLQFVFRLGLSIKNLRLSKIVDFGQM